jgi:hypothetical protein
LQDVLSQKTLAMLGGAPQPEVDRQATAEKADLDNYLASSPDADDEQSPEGREASSGGDTSPDTAGYHADVRAGRADEESAAALRELEMLRDAVLGETVKEYPDLGNRDSALWRVAAQMAREAHHPNHPDHLAGQQVEAPRYFAEKAAALLGVRPGGGHGAQVSVLSAVPVHGQSGPRPGPASGSKQTLPAARSLTEQQKIAAAHAHTLALIGGQAGRARRAGGDTDDDPASAVLVM